MQMQGMMLSFMQQIISTMVREQSSGVTPLNTITLWDQSTLHPTTSPYHLSLYHSDNYNSDK